MPTALITGAAGFVGHHLALQLSKEGLTVIGTDLHPLIDDKVYQRFFQADLGDTLLLQNMLANPTPTWFFIWLACSNHPIRWNFTRATFSERYPYLKLFKGQGSGR